MMDYLKGTDFKLYQEDDIFHINTDTVLLGEYLDMPKHKNVLDVGTNTGALLLYASRFEPLSLTGIDINKKALAIAKKNLALNNIAADLILGDIRDLKHELFDVIICNPPFYAHSAETKNFKDAKCDDSMPLDDLFDCFRHLIKDNGYIYMCYPAKRLFNLYDVCTKYKYKIMKMRLVYNDDKEAIRVLVKLKRGKTSIITIESPLIIKH